MGGAALSTRPPHARLPLPCSTVPGSPLPPPSMDVSAVHAALAKKSYSAVATPCDDLLIQVAARGVATTKDWPYAVHLLAHLYLNDLNSARFLWKSLPQQVKDARPELADVWRIGQCLWIRDYAGVYAAAQGFEWGPELVEYRREEQAEGN